MLVITLRHVSVKKNELLTYYPPYVGMEGDILFAITLSRRLSGYGLIANEREIDRRKINFSLRSFCRILVLYPRCLQMRAKKGAGVDNFGQTPTSIS